MDNLPTHPLTAEDQKILSEICAPDAEITLKVGAHQQDDEILRYLYILTRASIVLERKRSGLIHVIGRLLHVIKNKPEVYQGKGYRSFDIFIKQHVVDALGMSNSTLRDAMNNYEAFPNVAPADVAEVGVAKMNLLRKLTNSTQPNHMLMVNAAKTQTYSQLMKVAAVKGNLSPGNILRDVVAVGCTKSQKKMWEKFKTDPRVIAHCQTEDEGAILEYMMAEVMSEWCASEADQPS